ncbi:MAG: 3-oxoacyl-[acyl-carrier-protein] synthase-3 [Parvicellaceae bacterium]|jgi:3-oxoacyl-[acyl-carrier-protein] synthase-3
MANFSISGVNITGVAACVPKNVVSNYDYELLSESERRMLVKTIGVETRHVAPKYTTTLDYACAAAEKLFETGNVDRSEIKLEIFVTQSRDYYLPSTAIIAQHKLGLGQDCMAFDIGLGCSGYTYGLSVIASMMKSTGIKKALLLVGDVSTVTCSYNDKSTYPLFGDAGTATLLELKEGNEWHFDLHSDGSGEEAIKIPHGGMRNLLTADSLIEKKREDGNTRADLHLQLDGLTVFNFSISKVPKSIRAFMEQNNVVPTSLDHFVMHQANKLMNESIRKKLKFEPEQVPYSLDRYGNTSSASIPLTMVTELSNELKTPKSLLLSGFGVGLSWGHVLIQTNSVICPPVLEI